MELTITPTQLANISGATEVLMSRLVEKVRFDAYDFGNAQIQAMLDADIPLNKAVLYSPIKAAAALNALVPTTWPGQPVDEDGNQVRMTFGEYLRVTEVTGGYVFQYAAGPKDANNNIQLPSYTQLKVQIAAAGGFLTQAEVDAIKIVEEPVE